MESYKVGEEIIIDIEEEKYFASFYQDNLELSKQ